MVNNAYATRDLKQLDYNVFVKELRKIIIVIVALIGLIRNGNMENVDAKQDLIYMEHNAWVLRLVQIHNKNAIQVLSLIPNKKNVFHAVKVAWVVKIILNVINVVLSSIIMLRLSYVLNIVEMGKNLHCNVTMEIIKMVMDVVKTAK